MKSSSSSILNSLWTEREEELMNPFEVVPAKQKKGHHKVEQPALLEFYSHPTYLIKQAWSTIPLLGVLSGKFFASGAVLEVAILLKKWSSRRSKEEKCLVRWGSDTILNWAHRFVDKHTTHMIDHTIYSVIEEWNSAKMACSYECFSLIKE